ncbi:MAG TPA: carboxypeptidase regulatory-like domain-containing protein [Terriglobia bacterium]|nr:carboxypeptidase regulatory-like domain-containing protein [Terriglobia bacterium]
MNRPAKSSWGCLLLCFSILIALCAPPAPAQTSTGEIDVTVADPSGAVIPGAHVTIMGTNTGNVVRQLATNSVGIAAAPLLRADTYNVIVSAAGFQQLVRKGIVLRVGAVLSLQLALETGSATQTVTVVGQTPLLQEKTGSLSQTINQQEIGQLPLNGRNYLQLGNLVPGAVPSHGSRDDTFSIYGNSGIQNAFLLDGARNENYIRGIDSGVSGGNALLPSRDAYRPPLDAIAEFSVETGNFSAEYGASAGSIVTAVTKSGTNQIHGSAYEFLRNDAFDARNFFAPPGPSPQLVQNQFGGSLGGPIIKNRAWIFGAYEGTGINSSISSVSTVPTAAQRSGDFGSTPVYNPFTTQCNAAHTVCSRSQFGGNTIPQADINSIGQSLVNRYPLPNLSSVANNYAQNSPQDTFNHNAIFRGDVQLSAQSSMFARLALTRYHILADASLPPPAQTPVRRLAHSWGVGYGFTHTFTPTLVNELRLNWTRFTLSQDATLALDQIIPGMLDPNIHSSIPTFNVTGFATLGAQASCCSNDPLDKSSGVWDLADNLSDSMGKHLLKFGAETLYIRPSTYTSNTGRGSMGFTGVFTQNSLSRTGTGNPLADLLLGTANTVNTGTVGNIVERGHYFGFYFQDDFSATRNLTLNLGLRYEITLPYIEGHDRMANFILTPGNPNFGQMILSGNPAFPRSLVETNTDNLAPRVGFAYRVPKVKDFVVRGAYGIFYSQDTGEGVNNRLVTNPPFIGYGGTSITSDQLFPSTGFVLSPTATAPRLPPINPLAFVLNPLSTASLVSWNLNHPTPYVQEWNFTLEKQLPWNAALQVSYVGNIGLDIWSEAQGNQPLTNGPGSPNSRRPLSKYTDAPINAFGPWNRSHYEGLSTRFEKRLSNGVQILTDFTYGNSMDLQNPAGGLCDGCNEQVQNAYNLNSLLGPSDQNVRLRYTFSGMWSLPFGTGHHLAGEGWQSALFGSWGVDGIYQAETGYPFTPVLSFDNANAGNNSWPNRVCNGALSNPTITEYFNTACFVTPPQYQFGNTGRNILFGPGINNLDFALHRAFRIPVGEQTRLEFRAEAFNFFNHPQFGQPGTTIGTTTAGTISSTSVANREIQLALRLSW